MPTYNFKQIQPVPTASDFVDIILTRTQRGTPTVVHEGYKIQRIRNFYMRKVKFTQQNFNEKLTAIIMEPRFCGSSCGRVFVIVIRLILCVYK